jgi:hypothetical protein
MGLLRRDKFILQHQTEDQQVYDEEDTGQPPISIEPSSGFTIPIVKLKQASDKSLLMLRSQS